jgi:hypothetical protein
MVKMTRENSCGMSAKNPGFPDRLHRLQWVFLTLLYGCRFAVCPGLCFVLPVSAPRCEEIKVSLRGMKYTIIDFTVPTFFLLILSGSAARACPVRNRISHL